MIAALKGSLRLREAGRVVVETGGVDYELFIPLSTYYRLPAAGAFGRTRSSQGSS